MLLSFKCAAGLWLGLCATRWVALGISQPIANKYSSEKKQRKADNATFKATGWQGEAAVRYENVEQASRALIHA